MNNPEWSRALRSIRPARGPLWRHWQNMLRQAAETYHKLGPA